MKFSGFKISKIAADDPSVPQPPTEEPPLVKSNEVSNMFHMVPDDFLVCASDFRSENFLTIFPPGKIS